MLLCTPNCTRAWLILDAWVQASVWLDLGMQDCIPMCPPHLVSSLWSDPMSFIQLLGPEDWAPVLQWMVGCYRAANQMRKANPTQLLICGGVSAHQVQKLICRE